MSRKLISRLRHCTPKNSRENNHGFALFEALIALLIIALGLLAILGLQLRTLADTQTSIKRAQAVDLVNQLAERIRTNPSSITNATSFLIGQGTIPTFPTNCETTPCDATQRALYDVNTWLSNVKDVMPLGDAAVFRPADYPAGFAGDTTQLGVLISWRANERKNSDGTTSTAYTEPFNVDTGFSGAGSLSCPDGRICHLQFIPLTSRCAPYKKSGSPQFFCAG